MFYMFEAWSIGSIDCLPATPVMSQLSQISTTVNFVLFLPNKRRGTDKPLPQVLLKSHGEIWSYLWSKGTNGLPAKTTNCYCTSKNACDRKLAEKIAFARWSKLMRCWSLSISTRIPGYIYRVWDNRFSFRPIDLLLRCSCDAIFSLVSMEILCMRCQFWFLLTFTPSFTFFLSL